VRFALAIVATLAFAPAAYAQGATVQAVEPYSWSPTPVTIKAGETVTWTWANVHNVRAKGTNWTAEGDTSGFQHTFAATGEYDYVCSFHEAQGMIGKVIVTDATGTPPPPPPPPPPSEQSFPNDQQPPTVFELVDEVRPKLKRVRVDGVRNGARVRFRLSEGARVEVRFKFGGVVVKRARKTFGTGRGRLTVRDRRMDGRYRVEVFARDLSGNRSAVVRDSVTVR
jgi:plastocyanin